MVNIPTELDDLPMVEFDERQQWPTLQDYLEEYYRQLGSQGNGLKTYLKSKDDQYEFDTKLEGLRGIVIIGGEPGSGKTALALQIGFDTAINERPVLIYSFEMPKHQLVTRFFQRTGRIGYQKMQHTLADLTLDKRFLLAQERVLKAAGRIIIRETRDFFEKTDGGSVNPVFDFNAQIQQIRQIEETYKVPPLVIIDSLHEIPVDAKESRDLKQKIDFIMLNLRNVCNETQATFLLISHQSRSGQANGGLQSFLGSASIEYTVDMALTITKLKDSSTEEARELIVEKNRYGPKPRAFLSFEGAYMNFVLDDVA